MRTVQELFGPVFETYPQLLVGWPDDKVWLEAEGLPEGLRAAFGAFEKLWPEHRWLADLDVYRPKKRFDLRVMRIPTAGDESRDARKPELDLALEPLSKHGAWCWSTGFGISLPYADVGPELKSRAEFLADGATEAWPNFYARRLAETSWRSLRRDVYRFASDATHFAEWMKENRFEDVLIPSVGICVHPWLFANKGLRVAAFDIAESAMNALRSPGDWPRIYARESKRRWAISEASSYGGLSYGMFDHMPHLEEAAVRAELVSRIRFDVADWAKLPYPDASFDVIFATNALPRGGPELRTRIFEEWSRVLRPRGFVFSVMHNAQEEMGAPFFTAHGWSEVDAVHGDPAPEGRSYQEYFPSG